jgi:ADP-ribose pyrophosphatase
MSELLISRECVYAGALLTVNRDRVGLPDGSEGVREWIAHPGAAAVVPIFDDGSTILVRQFRYATGRSFLEVPAGKIDAGETPAEVALRELEEETGWCAAHLDPLGATYPCIGYSNEIIHLFLARGMSEGRATHHAGEEIEVVRTPFDEATRLARTGEIQDAKSAVALLRAAEVVGR